MSPTISLEAADIAQACKEYIERLGWQVQGEGKIDVVKGWNDVRNEGGGKPDTVRFTIALSPPQPR